MLRKLIDWYADLERWQIAALEGPGPAVESESVYRRYFARHLAAMTPAERLQLRDFCVAYQGRRGWLAMAKLAALFTFMGVLLHLGTGKGNLLSNVAIANLFGISLVVGAIGVWFDSRGRTQGRGQRALRMFIGALAGAALAYGVLRLTGAPPMADIGPRLTKVVAGSILGALLVSLPMVVLGALRRRQNELVTTQLQRDAERERLARELSESQLRMLRAQIEPHFLFNTLGAVQQLAADGAPRAAALTADLIAFLRASFSDMRCEQVPLSKEFATTESYLRVMQARMGARLCFEVSLPAALAGVEVPSMIVLTLVENAIKHGIEPSLRGGEIRVLAEGGAGCVTLRVHDSGVGMGATAGSGAGLDNVRSRLQLAYGGAAALMLRDADPGVVAELRIPATVKEPA
ncbi:sensor histidine kinase [Telluria aromaticivorans]|uniref:Histidine kinase n=1 Tax=Telluria aromaticivorans TaxID=2725995 RepID=A0A7Y2JV90_9BURK|nr:histidine kinase [Telluria aromaticivorans]NNG21676.1 histidine kinase [Telluria aromaticivorans]